MYDPNFDQPNMSGDSGYYEEVAPGPLDGVKKNLKSIILLVVLLAVGYGLYYHFIGSVVDFTFEVKDLENKSVDGYRIKVTDSSEKVVLDNESSGSSSAKLKFGDYKFNIEKSGFKSIKNAGITVSPEKTSESVQLEKITNVEIQSIEVPSQVFAGQTIEVKIVLKNSGTKSEEIEIVFDTSNAKGIALPPITAEIPQSPLFEQKTELKIPEDIQIKDARNGDVKKFTAKIRYTNKKSNEVSFKVLPQPKIEISKPTVGSFKAGDSKNIEIKITNREKFDVSDVTVSIENILSEKNDAKDVEDWITFASPERTTTKVSLKASQSETVTVILKIPLSAKIEQIFAKIVLNSPNLNAPFEKDFSFNISSEVKATVTASISKRTVTVPYDRVAERYRELPNNVVLTFKNTGSIDVQNVEVGLENQFECSEAWIVFVDDTIFDLQKGANKTVNLTITAPETALQDDQRNCLLRYRYDFALDDPGNPETVQWISIAPLVITPQAHD